jgi:predicted transcriptional regulator
MEKLMDKLVKAKAIMDKSENIKTSDLTNRSMNMVQQFESPNVRYNIPDEMLIESQQTTTNTKPVGVPTIEAIKKSKLPDEIKKLMIEHPINQPQQSSQTTLSDDLIERASRLMNLTNSENIQSENVQKPKKQVETPNLDYNVIQKMIEEAVNKALKENGLVVESTEKSNENFSFRVGKHLFEGKISKIKKIV